jgi:predicted TIM-barrel fold metal-dependent hydrolase
MAMTQVQDRTQTGREAREAIGIIDADMHPQMNPATPEIVARLPKRWQEYLASTGFRAGIPGGERPRHRAFASRSDAVPPKGGAPGSDPEYAREKLLDAFGISGAIANDIGAFFLSGAQRMPVPMVIDFCSALNDDRCETWLAADPRWYASVTVPWELPHEAADEIRRCREEMGEFGDRWVQVLLAPDNERPAGHPRYWPIYEACEHYGIPVGFHVLAHNKVTPSGSPNYYFEEHCDFAAFNFPLVSSLVFEGVFERFPRLKVAMLELSWSWAVPLAWRMDHAYRVMRREVPHLQRLPSEYIRDHFWYTTQPMEEPDEPRHFDDILRVFEESGMADKLMYSSDYPHWDFDAPSSLPAYVLRHPERARRILGENASACYGIGLLPDAGWAP